MTTYLVAMAVIFAVALAGVLVNRLYRRFAAAHPQLGPYRDPDKCSCCKNGDGCSDAKECESR
ncbi:MAG: hypothetical protein HZC24_01335 [Rhodocyclales bacterium]|nr:hypothetical protein [Rhodocyclales bacterium]